MTIYTYWGNRNEKLDGTSVLYLKSGPLEIGHAGDFTSAEFEFLSTYHILLPGTVPWSRTDFPWEVGTDISRYYLAQTSGGASVYQWVTPGVPTVSALPLSGNTIGQATLVQDTGTLYYWNGTAWTTVAVFGGASGGSSGSPHGNAILSESFLLSALGGVVGGSGPAIHGSSALTEQFILSASASVGGGLASPITGGKASTTTFTQVVSGGTASTTSFTQVVSGGNASGSGSSSGPVANLSETFSLSASGVGTGGTSGAYVLPPNRTTTWNPGLNSSGGIPNRSIIYATISPSGDTAGAADVTAIQNAINSCPANQVVKLTAGTFYIAWNSFIQITNSNITLRGAGPGNGNMNVSNTQEVGSGTGTFLVKTPTPSGNTGYPVLIIGPQWGPNGAAINLTADVAKGANTATVTSVAGLAAGDLVIVNQLNGTTTVASGSNGVNANTFTGSGVLNVLSTAGFLAPGWLQVVTSGGSALITYSSITGTQFTGCNFVSGQAGTMATGAAVIDTTVSHWDTVDPENASGWFDEPNRPIGDTMEILSISGNTITFTSAFHIGYTVAQTAHLLRLTTPVKNSGVEEVYCYNGTGGDGGGGIHMWNAGYCWVRHIEDTWSVGAAIHIDQCFRCEIRDSYFHDSQNGLFSGGSNYGIGISWYSSNILIENNISIKFNKCMVMRSAGGGNVIGYNYMDDGADSGGSWFETVLNSSHMTTPHYELFEGNEGADFDQDDRWGNSIYITVFRNHLIGQLRDFPNSGPKRSIGITQWHWWQSFVGNVLGNSGQTWCTAYENFDETSGCMWMMAYQSSGYETVLDNGKTLATQLRDGNYDYFTNHIHWHGIGGQGANSGLTTPINSIIPNSLYLTSKPAFFGSNTWPWVDGTNSANPLPGQLPARARYDLSTPNQATSV